MGMGFVVPSVELAADKPWFWLIAGINGAGKSTLVDILRRKRGIIDANYYNPDAITQWILEHKDLGRLISKVPGCSHLGLTIANKHAADLAMDIVNITLEKTDGSLAIETVLSTTKYRDCVNLAAKTGRRFGFVYVGLKSPEQAIERVKARVARGGHNVPEEKVRKRWAGSLAQLPWFVAQSDLALIFSNANDKPDTLAAGPVQLAFGPGNKLTWQDKNALPHITAALNA